MNTVTWGIGVLLFVITLSGNGLLIFLIVRRRSLRTTSNYFVLSLALADFCCGVVYSSVLLSTRSSNRASFILLGRFLRYSLYVSMTNLCALTVDRYLAIVNPLRYVTLMTMRHIFFMITVAWGLPLIMYLAPSLALKFRTSGGCNSCFVGFLCFVQVCVCVALLFATTRIFLVARRHARRNAIMLKQLLFNHRLQHGRAFRPREAASAKVVGCVVGIFIICYAVNIYQNICLAGFCEPPRSFGEYKITLLLKIINSAVNPVAYAFFKKDIKTELKRFIPLALHRTSVSPRHENEM